MYICLDYGLKRIGVALSHNGKMAHPLCTIPNHGDAKNLAALRAIIAKNTTGGVVYQNILPPVVVVLGVPNGLIAEHAHRFGGLIAREIGAVVDYHDENFTSIEAEAYLRETLGMRDLKKIKELLDPTAATMILNSYLETKGE